MIDRGDPGSSRWRVFPVLAFLLVTGCQKKVTGPPPRYVILRFENLSGDPSLEWVARAASEFLSRSLAGALDGPVLNSAAMSRLTPTLGGRPARAPGISSERTEAVLAGATRMITGYLDQTGGSVRLEATEMDIGSGKSIRSVSGSDPEVMKALTKLSRQFSPTAQPYLTASPEALRYFVSGFEDTGEQAVNDLQRSIEADSSYGPAWVQLVNADLSLGKRADAEAVLDTAQHHPLDQFDEANLNLASAILRNDRGDRLSAVRRISALSPGDTVLLRSAAEADTHAGDFETAAEEWNKLAAILPNDGNAWNQLGYTRAWGGDYKGALAAIVEYARLLPNDPNPIDSKGDIQYLFRKYSEAAASYLQADTKYPTFLEGGDLYKAAWAKFRAGDKAGADATFARFRAVREKSKAREWFLVEADWLYRTGRKTEAISLLRAHPDPTVESQLALWDLLAGNRGEAAREAALVGQSGTPAALLARFASLPSASAAEWQRRAEQMLSAPALAPFRTAAVGYALLFDGKRADALPIWKEIAENSAGTDFFSRAIYDRLKGGQPKLDLLPDPNSVNQFAALLDSL